MYRERERHTLHCIHNAPAKPPSGRGSRHVGVMFAPRRNHSLDANLSAPPPSEILDYVCTYMYIYIYIDRERDIMSFIC